MIHQATSSLVVPTMLLLALRHLRQTPADTCLAPPSPSPHAVATFLSSHRASTSSTSRTSPLPPSSHVSYSYSSSSKRDLPLWRPDKQRHCLRDSSSTKLRSSCSPAPSKDSVESVLQALWPSCRTNLHTADRAVVRNILQISTARETPTDHQILLPCTATLQIQSQEPGLHPRPNLSGIRSCHPV
jgi:hypothetical protein